MSSRIPPLTDRNEDGSWEDPEELQAFYAEAEPCESCGKPTWQGRRWDEDFQGWIAVDCKCNAPDAPTCPPLIPLIEAAQTVGEICAVIREHRRNCPLCGPQNINTGSPVRRPVTGDDDRGAGERQAA